MIQCALNGDFNHADHPLVPVTVEEIAEDAAGCLAAGAHSVHLHPRRGDGSETLEAAVHDAVVAAVRSAAPRLEISCSTHQDIDLGGADTRIEAVKAWTQPPDAVSLNVSESGVDDLAVALLEAGVGIEAGVFTLRDAHAFVSAPWAREARRVLVEVIFEHEDTVAVALAREIDRVVQPLGRPRLWHGDARSNWAVVDAGLAAGVDIRVGLEDTLIARDGGPAPGNPGQVADAVAVVQRIAAINVT